MISIITAQKPPQEDISPWWWVFSLELIPIVPAVGKVRKIDRRTLRWLMYASEYCG